MFSNHQKMENVESVLPLDRISNLPNNVAETILMYLPTRDAVRTSVLSSKWRHTWTKLPQLVLDESLWENVAIDHSSKTTFTKVLLKLLLSHDGPINKFTLSHPKLKSCLEIDNLISFLSKHHIEDFSLEMWKDRYLLPISVFTCPTLRYLKLRLCSIRSFPSAGFSKLTSVKLIEVAISDETLASLISGSPLLELLELEVSYRIAICIDAPNLKTFIFSGPATSINFKRVPLLGSLSIEQKSVRVLVQSTGVKCSIVKFFQSLLILESLQLNRLFFRSFNGISTKGLPTLIYLKDLKLSQFSFNKIKDLSFTFGLLRSAPNLKSIDILFRNSSGSNPEKTTRYMEGKDYSDICLTKLQKVRLGDIVGTKPELDFVKLLLGKSSSLKEIELHPRKGVCDKGFNILKEVIRFRRISKDAEIIFA